MAGRTTKHFKRSALAVRLGASARDGSNRTKLTQEKPAEEASLSKNYIGNIERGEYDVSVSVLKRVAVALGRGETDLLAAADL